MTLKTQILPISDNMATERFTHDGLAYFTYPAGKNEFGHFVIVQDGGAVIDIDFHSHKLMTWLDVKRLSEMNFPDHMEALGELIMPWSSTSIELAWTIHKRKEFQARFPLTFKNEPQQSRIPFWAVIGAISIAFTLIAVTA